MNEVDNVARGEIHDAVGSYVVHALEEPELSQFEAHVGECEQCSAEIREFSETLAGLSADFEVAPPAELRNSVLSAISGISQLPAESEAGESEAETGPRHAVPVLPRASDQADGWAGGQENDQAGGQENDRDVESDRTMAQVVSLDDVRRRRAPRALIAVAAAVALIAVAAGGWAVNLNQKLQQQQAGQSVVAQQTQRESALLNASDATIYSSTLPGGAKVSYVVSKQQNAAMLVSGDLPNPGAGKAYQIWTVRGKDTFYRDQAFTTIDQQRVFLSGNIGQADALGLSIETAGSTPSKPSTGPYAVANL